jgi:chromosome segregation ATPase
VKLRQAWGIMAVTVAVAVAACAPPDNQSTRHDAPWYVTAVEPMQSDTDRVARFYDRVLALKANELAGELDVTRQSFEKDKSELNRLQLALLLSLPGASFRDDNAAIALLHPFTKEKGREGSTLRPLAIWLHSELLELRRIEEILQQQAAKLKDEQRRTEEILQQHAAKLKEEQRRVEALQQKLEAILDMEMKMIEREQNLPKKK